MQGASIILGSGVRFGVCLSFQPVEGGPQHLPQQLSNPQLLASVCHTLVSPLKHGSLNQESWQCALVIQEYLNAAHNAAHSAAGNLRA